MVEVYLQAKRDGAAAKRLFRRLLRNHGGEPRKIVTDKVRSYGVAHRDHYRNLGMRDLVEWDILFYPLIKSDRLLWASF